jgi:hypothetical protein
VTSLSVTDPVREGGRRPACLPQNVWLSPHGGGTRVLGVPTVADRIAQTVVARRLEAKVEPIFHRDSSGCVCPEQGRELEVGRAS